MRLLRGGLRTSVRVALITCCTLAVGVGGLWITPARAYQHNCGVLGHYYDGFYSGGTSPVGNPEGVSAYITIRRGELCDTDTSTSNSNDIWTMLASKNSDGGWLQSGLDRTYGNNAVHFAQATRCYPGCIFYNHFGPEAPANYGEVHRYWTQYATDFAGYNVNVDQTQFMRPPIDTKTSSFWTIRPWYTQWFAETAYMEDSVPGTATATTHWNQMQIQVYNQEATWSYSVPAMTPLNNNSLAWAESPQVDFGSCTGGCFDVWTR
jgi:hypothetical protein